MSTQPTPSVVDFEYDVMTKRLDVWLADGTLRRYQRVSRSVHAAMEQAADATEFYRSNILSAFAYTIPAAGRLAA